MTRAGRLAVTLAAAAALLSSASAYSADPTVVEIGMINKQDGSQFMILGRGTVHAGPIIFRVKNRSNDMVHEFLVVQTDLDPNALPMEEDGTKVDEAKLKEIKEIKELGDLDPGKSSEMRMMLKPGRYLMFCNQPGHFRAGMFAILVVTP